MQDLHYVRVLAVGENVNFLVETLQHLFPRGEVFIGELHELDCHLKPSRELYRFFNSIMDVRA